MLTPKSTFSRKRKRGSGSPELIGVSRTDHRGTSKDLRACGTISPQRMICFPRSNAGFFLGVQPLSDPECPGGSFRTRNPNLFCRLDPPASQKPSLCHSSTLSKCRVRDPWVKGSSPSLPLRKSSSFQWAGDSWVFQRDSVSGKRLRGRDRQRRREGEREGGGTEGETQRRRETERDIEIDTERKRER